jgi:hypothetical protein
LSWLAHRTESRRIRRQKLLSGAHTRWDTTEACCWCHKPRSSKGYDVFSRSRLELTARPRNQDEGYEQIRTAESA